MATARPRRPVTAVAGFLSLLWRIPLYAVPFTLFFLLVLGAPMARWKTYYLVSLVFTTCTSLTV